MIAHHFGTDEIPRQCVTPGDYVLHEGRTYIASANNIERENSIFVTSQQKHALPTA
mgnify:CR=1 FL=1